MHAGRSGVLAFLTALLFLCAVSSSDAENIVSRPVGFVRLETMRSDSVLAAAPFASLGTETGAVLVWDAAGQAYSITSPPMPGHGYWLQTEDSGPHFLLGEVVLEESSERILLPGLNLVGFPYSSGVEIDQTELAGADVVDRTGTNRPAVLSAGDGYWLNHTGAETRVWVEIRPYDNVFPVNDEPPLIESLEVLNGTAIVISVRCSGVQGESLDIFYHDSDRTVPFCMTSGWSMAEADLIPDGTRLSWTDTGSSNRPPVTETELRYYLVARSDIDSDGDGVPDALEIFVYGSDPGVAVVGGAISAENDSGHLSLMACESSNWVSGISVSNSWPQEAVPVLGAIIYVDQRRGRDTFTGRLRNPAANDGPKGTIRAGLVACREGGMVVIEDGCYTETLDVQGRNIRVLAVGRVNLTGGPISPEPPGSTYTNTPAGEFDAKP